MMNSLKDRDTFNYNKLGGHKKAKEAKSRKCLHLEKGERLSLRWAHSTDLELSVTVYF